MVADNSNDDFAWRRKRASSGIVSTRHAPPFSSEDAHRNALNGHCYWLLRQQGKSATQATAALLHLSVAQKNALLFQAGINFNDVPLWHKRGVGIYWETYEKSACNPKTGEPVTAVRRRLRVDYELPMKERYSAFMTALLADAG